MEKAVKSIQKPAVKQEFAKVWQQLKVGIKTLPTEGKVPLKWKPLWHFLCKEFADLDIHFIGLFIPIISLIGIAFLSTLIVPWAISNNGLLPVYLLGIVTISGFIILAFFILMQDRGKIFLWLKNKKKISPMLIKVLSLSSIIIFSILLISISMVRPVGNILIPLAMVAVIWWLIAEIVYLFYVFGWLKNK